MGWHDDTVASAPSTLVLITGDESLLVDRAVSRAVQAARKAEPETERRDSAAAGLTPHEFADLVAPGLMFGVSATLVGTGSSGA